MFTAMKAKVAVAMTKAIKTMAASMLTVPRLSMRTLLLSMRPRPTSVCAKACKRKSLILGVLAAKH
jgi:hypothetical protein